MVSARAVDGVNVAKISNVQRLIRIFDIKPLAFRLDSGEGPS
jgi:hypothetical protein